MMKNEQGYSLLEIILVVIVLGIVGTAVAFRVSAAMVTLDVDVTTRLVVEQLAKSRRQALSGKDSGQFNLATALARFHPGIVLSAQMAASSASSTAGKGGRSEPGTGDNSGCGGNCAGQTICIGGQPFCYAEGGTFTFEPYSGRLADARVLFINSKARKVALLINTAGTVEVLERVNNEWQLQSALEVLSGYGSAGKSKSGGKGDPPYSDPPVGGGGGGKGPPKDPPKDPPILPKDPPIGTGGGDDKGKDDLPILPKDPPRLPRGGATTNDNGGK